MCSVVSVQSKGSSPYSLVPVPLYRAQPRSTMCRATAHLPDMFVPQCKGTPEVCSNLLRLDLTVYDTPRHVQTCQKGGCLLVLRYFHFTKSLLPPIRWKRTASKKGSNSWLHVNEAQCCQRMHYDQYFFKIVPELQQCKNWCEILESQLTFNC